MKLIVIFVVIVVASDYTCAVVSQELMLSVRPLLLECARQNRVTDYQITAIIANDLRDQSPNIQCLSLCLFQKLGMMDANGNVDLVRTISSFSLGEDSMNVIRVVRLCKDLKGHSPCHTSSRIYRCYVQNGLL